MPPSAKQSRFFEDFEVGARYPTRERKITDADHEAFCRLVGYEVPMFLEYGPERLDVVFER